MRHIFESLNLVHQGSLAYNGQEFVLHDNVRGDGKDGGDGKDKKNKSLKAAQCVAWDDAMRAMSSIPTVRIALERLWLSHRRPSEISSSFEDKDKGNGDNNNAAKDKKDGNNNTKDAKDKSKIALDNDKVSDAELSLLKEEYTKNRLLLGPVDFYRLFVPTLPETAIPEGDSNNRGRMEQLLCWRKRVARASVLVRSYTRARLVANRGWNLDLALPRPGTSSTVAASAAAAVTAAMGDHGGEYITKRFAYDGNENNNVRDIAAKNEIYEASVSRDVLCHVRPFNYLNNERDCNNSNDESGESGCEDDSHRNSLSEHHQSQKHLVLSPYQAYTYVDSHYFKTTDEMLKDGGPLHPSRDPVDMFPSLKEIIVQHPDLDFFVDCISNPEDNILMINLHVRSLAKGIDPQFDNVVSYFCLLMFLMLLLLLLLLRGF